MREIKFMEKKNLVIALILLCFLCLGLSVFTAIKKPKFANVNSSITSAGAKIALINIEGVISSSSENTSPFSYVAPSAQNALKAIQNAQKDSSVKAVIIQINSPGGTVAASQNLYDAIMRLRKEKPVVVSMQDVAASGGYYLAAAADRIVAQRGTITGSIGVIFSTMDIHGLLSQKLSVYPIVIKSGKFKDMGSSTKPMSLEERQLFQDMIDDSYKQFIDDIEKARVKRNDTFPLDKKILTPETLREYADGRVFTGSQAYSLGFVDVLGDLEDAHVIAKTLAVEKFKLSDDELPMVLYNKTSPLKDLFTTLSETVFPERALLRNLVPESMRHGRVLMYLWE